MSEGYVRSETHNGITTVEFYHPQSNSLPARLLEGLANEIHGIANDDDTKVIILRSGGEKAFCAGASFDELMAIKTHEQKISYEMNVNKGKLNNETIAEHENLLDQYQSLELTLQDLREEFDGFLSRT